MSSVRVCDQWLSVLCVSLTAACLTIIEDGTFICSVYCLRFYGVCMQQGIEVRRLDSIGDNYVHALCMCKIFSHAHKW